jgi:hypothetical protein
MAELNDTPQVHRAMYEFEAGPIRSRASASITTGGMLAVAVILLSIVPIVWAATGPARIRAQGAGSKALPDIDR